MIIQGNKIILRDWKETDFDLYRYYSNPDLKWHRFNGPYFPVKSEDKIESFISKVKENSF